MGFHLCVCCWLRDGSRPKGEGHRQGPLQRYSLPQARAAPRGRGDVAAPPELPSAAVSVESQRKEEAHGAPAQLDETAAVQALPLLSHLG